MLKFIDNNYLKILISASILLFSLIISSVFSYLIIKAFNLKEKDRNKIKNNPFYKPLRLLCIFIGIYVALYVLEIPENFMEIWKKIFRILIILIASNGLANFVDPKSNFAKKIVSKNIEGKDKTLVNVISKFLKFLIYTLAIFCIIPELGYNISSLVAGLGIGGAIVALAAQDIVKCLLSGLSILTDKPFLVGDWIEVNDNQGTVIDITFRSTKIKTLDNTIITIPNSTLTSTPVINWSRLEKRRFLTNIQLPLDTDSSKVQNLISQLKIVLQTVHHVDSDSVSILFNNINKEGIDILIYLYTDIVNYDEFLKFKQEINTQILKVVEKEGLKLSYASQNVYIKES